ncbi:type II toxin-antitoxin system RelE/ParE family toxin [Massilia violaceinigra]|uniref:type II toxin-antitoxin system RelE/ParE family toxin n=1 Tax=Massilia violaceinigra TaxID=2045208 RepID=UPI001FB44926|nr:type II toxin-antitoxin system RelE/ParE family toxin [Massilia violaceinigra]
MRAPVPHLRFSTRALLDLKRLREFLQPKSPAAAKRAAQAIVKSLRVLSQRPRLGRPIPNLPFGNYEFVISYGNAGYIARYRFTDGVVTILSVRHQKEASP